MAVDNPATRLVTALGGVKPAARTMEVNPNAVQGWLYQGVVPVRRIRRGIKEAAKRGVRLDLDDLVP